MELIYSQAEFLPHKIHEKGRELWKAAFIKKKKKIFFCYELRL